MTSRPPMNCPECGAEVKTMTRRMRMSQDNKGQPFRQPVIYEAEYHCGAEITSRLRSGSGFGRSAEHVPDEKWSVDAKTGCQASLRKWVTKEKDEGPTK